MKETLSGISSGIAGEFYVAAELTKRGYVASLTSKNTKAIDLLASNDDGSKVVSIQVKTSRNGNSFTLSEKDEKMNENDSLFYVFVNLNIDLSKKAYGQVEYYVVPMKKVKEYIYSSHRKWLNSIGAKGQKHNDNPIRRYIIQPDDVKNNFSVLGLE